MLFFSVFSANVKFAWILWFSDQNRVLNSSRWSPHWTCRPGPGNPFQAKWLGCSGTAADRDRPFLPRGSKMPCPLVALGNYKIARSTYSSGNVNGTWQAERRMSTDSSFSTAGSSHKPRKAIEWSNAVAGKRQNACRGNRPRCAQASRSANNAAFHHGPQSTGRHSTNAPISASTPKKLCLTEPRQVPGSRCNKRIR